MQMVSSGSLPVSVFNEEARYPVLHLDIVNSTTGIKQELREWPGLDWQAFQVGPGAEGGWGQAHGQAAGCPQGQQHEGTGFGLKT